MFYTIYKTTNLINNRYYIGKHKTKNVNDSYMGSGKLLKWAIEKYGIENFSKEILFVFDNEEDMNKKEKELVVLSEETYNLCKGGNGGFGYINNSDIIKFKGKTHTDSTKQKIREKRIGVTNFIPNEETKLKISNSKLGKSTALKGSSQSEEHKKKLSEATKAYWAKKRNAGLTQ
ncbi:grpIintron_endo, group I intron endonuclease [uncultured Caudovirales phage]|uniref:GrpIintron_endo, group I intron endonuclease n=1 Tax=uncultured Caudovirales phage TaxID=2100421 RepID=A0A6J5QI83_9CAUD|nr:grpIintron_endo, group I intron endonuclease [uncultured Caudovirales phage]